MGNFGFKNVSKRNKIDLMEYLCYGLGDFSFCFIYGAIGSYIVYFYTDVACISAAVVGTILLFSKIFDGISDMLMGFIIDDTGKWPTVLGLEHPIPTGPYDKYC